MLLGVLPSSDRPASHELMKPIVEDEAGWQRHNAASAKLSASAKGRPT